MPSSSLLNSIDGQRFVASSTHIPLNSYDKINEDELKNLPLFQNYQKGIPSKVCINIFYKIIATFRISSIYITTSFFYTLFN